jgi:phosphodiesterase/alkaline phosphatase D-like protein
MKRLILTSAILAAIAVLGVTVASLMRWHFGFSPVMAAARPHQVTQFTAGPELEGATDATAIVRWTAPNPGGTALHYGVVKYGTSAMNRTEVASSPNRRNPSNPDMTFRVRIVGLNAHTTYYYTVESIGATHVSDGASSPVRTFQTQ